MRITAILIASLFLACGSDPTEQPTPDGAPPAGSVTGAATGGSSTTEAAKPGCPPARTPDDWHMCDTLFAAMGGVKGKTVADLFIGDGYYTMKLVEAGARVIAMDDDPRNVEALQAKKNELGICDERLIIRQAQPGKPNLVPNEVDMAFCSRQFISIPNPTPYFRQVKEAIRFPNSLFIVNFLPEQTPVGPPMDQRLPEDRIMDAMEPCGFTDIGSYSKKVPYRYLVHALTFVAAPGDEEDVTGGAQ